MTSDVPEMCARCHRFQPESRQCRLLAEPTPENRVALMTEECAVSDQLAKRPRWRRASPQEVPDCPGKAMKRWLDPEFDASRLPHTGLPLDARLWEAGSWWPDYLANPTGDRDRRTIPQADPHAPNAEFQVPLTDFARAFEELERLSSEDHAIVRAVSKQSFVNQEWAAEQGVSTTTGTNRKARALYRFFVLAHGLLDEPFPRDPQRTHHDAVVSRHFAPGVTTETQALAWFRKNVGEVTRDRWRTAYRLGVKEVLRRLQEAIPAAEYEKLKLGLVRELLRDAKHLGFAPVEDLEEGALETLDFWACLPVGKTRR